jgi:hypothetical protein
MKGRYTLTIRKVKEQGSIGFRARYKGLRLRLIWKLILQRLEAAAANSVPVLEKARDHS